MRRRRFMAAAAVALLSALGACRRTPPPASGPRIAVLSPALAAGLKDLGVEDRIVGRHAWDRVLDPTIPVVGDGVGDVDYERLAQTRPNLVVGEFGASGVPARLREMADARGWRLVAYNPLSLADVSAATASLGDAAEAAGCVGAKGRAAELEGELRAALTANPARAGAGRVLLVAEGSPLSVLGPGSVHHDILLALGGIPAITRGKAFISLDAEDVRALNPDAILIITPREPGAPAAKPAPKELLARLGRVGELDVAAVRGLRIALIDDPLTHLPASTIRTTARGMSAALDRWVAELR